MKDALYFSHDTNAFTDPKIISLFMNYGFKGYGIRWFLLEQLAQSNGYKYKIDDIGKLAFIARLDVEELTDLIMFMVEHELLMKDHVHFRSPSLKRRMEMKDAKQRARANAGRMGGIASGEARQKEGEPQEEAEKEELQDDAGSKNEANVKQKGSNASANAKQKGSKKERKKERKKKNNSANAPDGAQGEMSKNEQLFMQFWEHYPMKKNKKAAMEKFIAAMKKHKDPVVFVQKCIDAVKEQEVEKKVLQEKGKFCPEWKLPTTRINNACWDDEVQFKSIVTAKMKEKPQEQEKKEEKKVVLSTEQKAAIKARLGQTKTAALEKFTS